MPPQGCYLGAYIELDPKVKGDVVAFEQATGKRHATYLRYVGYGEPFPFKWVQDLHALGIAPQIAWEPNDGLGAVRDDEYLRGWAEAARRAGGPILLRYASEMNGNWQAYSGNPDEYVEKWQLVYRIFHEVAPNVVMIWCPFALPRATIEAYYPGDDFVDWVGVNIYAVINNDGDPRKPAAIDHLDQLRHVYALYGDRKPIAICEYAATHYCEAARGKATQFAVRSMEQMYGAVKNEFPNVVLLSWFSVDAVSEGLAHNEYALTTDAQVLATYRRLIADDYWLTQVQAGRPRGLTRVPAEIGFPGIGGQRPWPPAAAPTVTSVPLALSRSAAPRPDEIAIVLTQGAPAAATGKLTVRAEVGSGLAAWSAAFYLDGKFRAATNLKPFQFTLDADACAPGEHIIRAEVLDSSGIPLASKQAAIIIPPRE